MGAMDAILRRHGATLAERHGRTVAAHFGSPAAEAAVCRTTVGLAERSDRATLEVRGPRHAVDAALSELRSLGEPAWWTRVGPGRALVRCEADDEYACTCALLRADGVFVADVSRAFAAVDLVGPRAAEVLHAAALREDEEPFLVMRERPSWVELLIARSHGPALWNRLLDAGEPKGIACVGLDALEHLAVSEHLSDLRRVAGRPPAAQS